MAQDSSVCAADGLLALGHAWPLAGAAGPDTLQLLLALAALGHIATLLDVLVHETAAGSANPEKKAELLEFKPGTGFGAAPVPLYLHTAFVRVCVVRQSSSESQSLDHFEAEITGERTLVAAKLDALGVAGTGISTLAHIAEGQQVGEQG